MEIKMVRIRKPDIDGLINALRDRDADMRRSALLKLSIIGDERAVKPLMRVVEDEDEDGEVRQAAVCAVGRIGGKRAVESLIRVLVFSPTINSVLIKPTGDEGTIDLCWDADGWVRKGIVTAGEAVIESSTTAHVDMNVRRAAADALAEMGEIVIDHLIYKLKSVDLQANATVALVKIGGEKVVKPLINALKYKDWQMRKGAAYALVEIGDPAVEPLIRTLVDKQVRQAVVDVLVEIGEPAVGALINALKYKDWEVREGSINILGMVGDKRAVEPLINALGDENVIVRWAAAEAIGKVGNGEAVEPLINAFEDTDALVRESVVRALGEIGDARAIESLMKALEDEYVWVRKAATRALGRIGD